MPWRVSSPTAWVSRSPTPPARVRSGSHHPACSCAPPTGGSTPGHPRCGPISPRWSTRSTRPCGHHRWACSRRWRTCPPSGSTTRRGSGCCPPWRCARGPAPAAPVPSVGADPRLDAASVVVLGATWAAPLAALVLAGLGARVVRVVDPRRADPFPLRAQLRRGQNRATDRSRASRRSRPLRRAPRRAPTCSSTARHRASWPTPGSPTPTTPVVRIAAFAEGDRPGYGFAGGGTRRVGRPARSAPTRAVVGRRPDRRARRGAARCRPRPARRAVGARARVAGGGRRAAARSGAARCLTAGST